MPSNITAVAAPVMVNTESAVYLVHAVSKAFYLTTENLP